MLTWVNTYLNKKYGIILKDLSSDHFDNEKRFKQWEKLFQKKIKNIRIWVAKDNNIVVGFCFAEKKIRSNKIKSIYILPEFQNMGIGVKLITKALDWFGDKKTISAEMAIYNRKAIKFYKKFGFLKTEKLKKYYLPNKKEIPVIIMIKLIN